MSSLLKLFVAKVESQQVWQTVPRMRVGDGKTLIAASPYMSWRWQIAEHVDRSPTQVVSQIAARQVLVRTTTGGVGTRL